MRQRAGPAHVAGHSSAVSHVTHAAQQLAAQQQAALVIYPGVGVGPFRLGASIGGVLSLLHTQPSLLRGVPAKLVSSPSDPCRTDLSLELPALGLRLRFDAAHQRCHLIDAFDASRAPLVYMRSALSNAALSGGGGSKVAAHRIQSDESGDDGAEPSPNAPTFRQLYQLFGPTYLGTYDASTHSYMLQYPGVAMSFRVPGDLSAADTDGQEDGGASAAHEALLREGSSPPVRCLFVHGGAEVRHFAEFVPSILANDTTYEPLVVLLRPGGGVSGLYLERRRVTIDFSSRAQDLLSDLGAPQNIYVKQRQEDKMSIHKSAVAGSSSAHHSPILGARNAILASRPGISGGGGGGGGGGSSSASSAPSVPPTSDYFYNYFHLGFDALLDGVSHRVKKIVLHTNFVERMEFGVYARAQFVIQKAPEAGQQQNQPPASSHGGAASVPALSLLELPPTASQHASSVSSMLHPPGGRSLSGGRAGAEESNAQEVSLHVGGGDSEEKQEAPPANGGDGGGGDGGGGGGKKKKKKGKGGNSSDAPSTASATATATDAASESKESESESHAAANHAALALAAAESKSAAAVAAAHFRPPSRSDSRSPLSVSFSPSLSPSVLPVSHATVITPMSKWSDVLAVLGPCPSRPMVSSASGRSQSGAAGVGVTASGGSHPSSTAHAHTSPFSSATYFYAYEGVIFEVMKNHQLATVTLFDTETQ